MSMQSDYIRIAIVHNDGVYRDSLAQCLRQTDALSVVCAAASLSLSWETVLASEPELVVVQFGAAPECGALRELSAEGLKIIVVGVPNTDDDILSCIEGEGAAGYVLVDASLDDLLNNIHAVMRGETVCSPRIASLAFDRMAALSRRVSAVKVSANNEACLTRREAEIAQLIDEGLSNKEIAVRLHIEVSTVKNHVHNILDKLHLHNRYSAVKYLKEQTAPSGRL